MVLRIKCLKTTHYNAQYNPSPMHTKCVCVCICICICMYIYYMTIIFDNEQRCKRFLFYIIYNSILIGIPVTAWFHWSFLILMIWIMNRREGQMNDMLQTLSSVTGFNFTPTEGAVVLNWENHLTSSCAASFAFFFMFIFVLCRWIICFLWCKFTKKNSAEMDSCIINRTLNAKRYIPLPEADIVLLLYVRNWGTLLRKLPHWHIHCPDKQLYAEHRGKKKFKGFIFTALFTANTAVWITSWNWPGSEG